MCGHPDEKEVLSYSEMLCYLIIEVGFCKRDIAYFLKIPTKKLNEILSQENFFGREISERIFNKLFRLYQRIYFFDQSERKRNLDKKRIEDQERSFEGEDE